MDLGWPKTSERQTSDALGLGSLNLHLNEAASVENTSIENTTVPPPSHFVWEVEGKSVAVHLEFDLVDRLNTEIMRGFGLVPKRGAEVGGLLLGTVEISDKIIVRVVDFEQIPCDYRKGPSFILTENDEARFAAASQRLVNGTERRLYVVGLYRSHTRDNSPSLTDEDLELFRRYTNESSNIILLVKPFATKPSVAGIFFEEDGEFRRESSYHEFPFRRRELGGTRAPSAATESVIPEAPVAPPAPPASGEEIRDWMTQRDTSLSGALPPDTAASSKFRRKWVWIPLSFVFLLLGVIAGFQAALVLNRTDAQKMARESLSLGLTSVRDGEGILVRWDRQASAILLSKGGTLYIREGEFQKSVRLDGLQLQNGSVMYRSTAAAVTFRLEVATEGRTTVIETVDYSLKP